MSCEESAIFFRKSNCEGGATYIILKTSGATYFKDAYPLGLIRRTPYEIDSSSSNLPF